MPKLEKLGLEEIRKANTGLWVCGEQSITCKNLSGLIREGISLGNQVVLGMPEQQIEPGSRGWAKAQILASVVGGILGVVGLSEAEIRRELLNKQWKETRVTGEIIIENQKRVVLDKALPAPEFTEIDSEIFKKWMRTAWGLVQESNCWLDPAACLFIQKGRVIASGVSQRLHDFDCKSLPIDFKSLGLKEGERLLFCDSLHAERVGISNAVRQGISLGRTTAVMTKFPCRSCMQSLITAGVKKVVYEVGSYGYQDTELLVTNGVQIGRVETS